MLKPLPYKKLLHLLNTITSIEEDTLTFHAPYDSRKIWFKNGQPVDSSTGTWILKAGDQCSTIWQCSETKPKTVYSPVNWLSFSIDQLLSYRISDLTKAIKHWKRQLIHNRTWRLKTPIDQTQNVIDALSLCQRLYDIEVSANKLEEKLSKTKDFKERLSKKKKLYASVIETFWDQYWELQNTYSNEIPAYHNQIIEPAVPPLLRGLAFPKLPNSAVLQLSHLSGESEPHLKQSNTYLLIQSTLMRHIHVAQQFRRWLQLIPPPARTFAIKQKYEGFRWFSINLWLNAPLSRNRLLKQPALGYAVACIWKAPSKQAASPFLQLDRSLCGNHKQILSEMGLPTTWAMMRMIQEYTSDERQRLIPFKNGGYNISRCVLVMLKDHLSRLLARQPKMWPWIAHYNMKQALNGARFLNILIDQTESLSCPAKPTKKLFKLFILNPNTTKHVRFSNVRTLVGEILDRLSDTHMDKIERDIAHQFHHQLCSITSMRQLKELHEQVTHLYSLENKFPVESPMENLPSDWTELNTIQSIKEESQEMHHCLYERYLKDISEKTMSAYSIITLSKRRATLTIVKFRTGWKVDQLVYKNNTELLHSDNIEIQLALLERLEIFSEQSPDESTNNPEPQIENDPMIQNALTVFESTMAK